MKKQIGIIGYGNMGMVIGERLKQHKDLYELFIYDHDFKKTDQILDVQVGSSAVEVADRVVALILAVKPQDFDALLGGIKGHTHDVLVISIAAGLRMEYIEKYLVDARVVRVMPNMPARIGKGISCLCAGKFTSAQDLLFVTQLFNHLGETVVIPEYMMNSATAISGSGPGYFYDLLIKENINLKKMDEVNRFSWEVFFPRLLAAAKNIGFNEEQAQVLSRATVEGSLGMLSVTGLSPLELLAQIVSKGGTTEAALQVLHSGAGLKEAVEVARRRAEELSKRIDYTEMQ
ncbi:MAG: pyrroline-5-carboxylate reductase [Candidatus Omnitrophota bacterium]|jgi:pyrroline-5-carboxylate reductase